MKTIREAAAALRARNVSCEELVTEALEAEQAYRHLNSFITLTADRALTYARQLDRELKQGHDRGPLHGIPIAHKDLFHTAGVHTTDGSKLFAHFIPDSDAAVVEDLREAGAISLGKLNMHELAYGISSTNPHYGPVRNPHDPERIPGGSSGGSGVAVATGIVFGATGSDTGGSIRIPASFCGTVGFKPTYGRVSCEGCFPLGVTLDHMGPLARTVDDIVLLLEAMLGERITLTGRTDIRIGLPEDFYFDGVQPEVGDAVQAAARQAEKLGAKIVPIRVPEPEHLVATARTILLLEAATVLAPHMDRREDIGPETFALLESGGKVTIADYIQATANANRLRALWAKLFEDVDVLFTPTTPTVAPKIGQTAIQINGQEHDTRLLTTRFCRGINLLGYPAISIPRGTNSEGLPIGLQIVGALNRDTTVLDLAAALE
jgi:aspartyl-tRNA(Asn)/glutamyl-tRNA(Gln) amidotransferase subunit A